MSRYDDQQHSLQSGRDTSSGVQQHATENQPNSTSGVEEAKEQVKETASDLVSEARHKAKEAWAQARRSAQHGAADQRQRLAGRISTIAGAFHEAAGRLEEKEEDSAAEYVHMAADRMDDASDYIRSCELSEIRDDAAGFVRSHPVAMLGGALVTGVAIARFLRSSQKHRHQQPEQGSEQWENRLPIPSEQAGSSGRTSPGRSSPGPGRTLATHYNTGYGSDAAGRRESMRSSSSAVPHATGSATPSTAAGTGAPRPAQHETDRHQRESEHER